MAQLTGVASDTLRVWRRQSVVKPSAGTAPTGGRPGQLWTTGDLLAVAVVAEIRRHGLSLRIAGQAANVLRGIDLDDIAPGTRLYVRDGHTMLVPAGEQLPKGRSAFFLDLTTPVAELRRKVAMVTATPKLERRLAARAITLGRVLAALGGSARPTQLRRLTGQRQTTHFRAMGDLEQAGLIHRTDYVGPGRPGRLVTFTDAGSEAFGVDDVPEARLAG